uniref:Uncharacterized protein n=1 Tax=Chromera velia CCMP2878 TaxID=1169474 RepID=A0A0K6S836_9ALVE|eukprot:Cvel_23903.t1-p1 / transcript=Cvel_23903.t1 / gene=Cvel_23903 / organism=Chromera_velia_CCMP2878 / gene_product=hypothetical protein / transcript_product=hypothetical protein / location=Cvel_scaffold2520:17370-18488(-) / protein_length=260 / sequence_SO=supercontig / SO=protein_coding / is_pseudo=false
MMDILSEILDEETTELKKRVVRRFTKTVKAKEALLQEQQEEIQRLMKQVAEMETQRNQANSAVSAHQRDHQTGEISDWRCSCRESHRNLGKGTVTGTLTETRTETTGGIGDNKAEQQEAEGGGAAAAASSTPGHPGRQPELQLPACTPGTLHTCGLQWGTLRALFDDDGNLIEGADAILTGKRIHIKPNFTFTNNIHKLLYTYSRVEIKEVKCNHGRRVSLSLVFFSVFVGGLETVVLRDGRAAYGCTCVWVLAACFESE